MPPVFRPMRHLRTAAVVRCATTVALCLLMYLNHPVVALQNPPGSEHRPDVKASVLESTAAYLRGYARDAMFVVREEQYTQQSFRRGFAEITYGRVTEEREVRRVVHSDICLIENPDPHDARLPFLEFRDVTSVDGKAVNEGREPFTRLLQKPGLMPSSSLVRVLADASARYNIGGFQRNLNLPTLALAFLHPNNSGRSECRVEDNPGTAGATALITCRETATPSLIVQAFSGMDLPAQTKFWVDPRQGRVVRTELRVGAASWHGEIVVEYGAVPCADVWLPASTREDYLDVPARERVEASATYRNARRFVTSGRVLPQK